MRHSTFRVKVPGQKAGLQIQSNGSLTPLPSSPESAVNGSFFGPSPTLPLLFLLSNGNPHLESLLINPDYSLTSYSSAPLAGSLSQYARPVVDPTGSNLYLPGPIDSSGAHRGNHLSRQWLSTTLEYHSHTQRNRRIRVGVHTRRNLSVYPDLLPFQSRQYPVLLPQFRWHAHFRRYLCAPK